MGWKSETSSNTKNLWNLSLHKDDTSPTSAGKERRSIKRHSRGKHVQGTHRDLGIGLRKFQNSFELKPYKFLIRGAKIVSQKHRETRLVHTKKGVKLSREKSGAECGGLSWRYWRSGLERKARVCDDRGKKRSRESIGEVSWLPKVRASLCFSSFLSFFLCFGNRPSSWTGEDDPIPARMDGWMDGVYPFCNKGNFSWMFNFLVDILANGWGKPTASSLSADGVFMASSNFQPSDGDPIVISVLRQLADEP